MTAPTPDINGILRAHMAVERYRDELEVSLAAVTADLNASIQMHEEARSLLDRALTERDQARQMLADAPHNPFCTFSPHSPNLLCTCWKAGL